MNTEYLSKEKVSDKIKKMKLYNYIFSIKNNKVIKNANYNKMRFTRK